MANPEKKFIKEAIIGYSPQVVEAVKKFKLPSNKQVEQIAKIWYNTKI